MAAEEGDGALGGDARAGGAFAKHHGDGLAGEGGAVGLELGEGGDLGFAGGGIANESGEFIGGEIVDGGEMAGRGGCGRGVGPGRPLGGCCYPGGAQHGDVIEGGVTLCSLVFEAVVVKNA